MAIRDEMLRAFYEEEYQGSAITARDSHAGRYIHKALERGLHASDRFPRVLELGGNRGEHVPFVRHAYDTYVLSDVNPVAPTGKAAVDPRVAAMVIDAARIPFPEDSFDRVISTCLLHHVNDPITVAREMRRVVRPGGLISILLPTDPGLAYRTAHRLTSVRRAGRSGKREEFELLHALDHRNHFRSVAIQLRTAFAVDACEVTWLPLHVPSVELNLFTVWHVKAE